MKNDLEATKKRPHLARIATATLIGLVCFAPSQVTVQHWLLCAAGVQYGRAMVVDAQTLQDGYRVFGKETTNRTVWIEDQAFELDVLTADGKIRLTEALEAKPGAMVEYRLQTGDGIFTRLALACPGIGITPADLVLLFAFLLVVIASVRRRDWRALLPPVPLLALFAAGALSLSGVRPYDQSFMEPDLGGGLKELLQMVIILGCGILGVRWLVRHACLTAVLWALFGACCLVCVWGLTELAGLLQAPQPVLQGWDSTFGFSYNPTRSGITGSESSQHVFAAFLCLLAPFALAALLRGQGPIRFLAGGALVLALACQLHLGLLICMLAGLALVALLDGRNWLLPAVLCGSGAVIALLVALQPMRGEILLNSVAIHRTADRFGLVPVPMTHADDRNERWVSVQQKYLEWQAALNAVSFSPVVGYGLGSYQTRINAFYASARHQAWSLLKAPVNLMERDAHSQYKVTLVETGISGFLVLLWLWLAALRGAVRTSQTDQSWQQAVLSVGVAGALLAMLCGAWFASFMVRGLQIYLVFLLAVAFPRQCQDA